MEEVVKGGSESPATCSVSRCYARSIPVCGLSIEQQFCMQNMVQIMTEKLRQIFQQLCSVLISCTSPIQQNIKIYIVVEELSVFTFCQIGLLQEIKIEQTQQLLFSIFFPHDSILHTTSIQWLTLASHTFWSTQKQNASNSMT